MARHAEYDTGEVIKVSQEQQIDYLTNKVAFLEGMLDQLRRELYDKQKLLDAEKHETGKWCSLYRRLMNHTSKKDPASRPNPFDGQDHIPQGNTQRRRRRGAYTR